jgi:pyruvate/2-oxoacid:ferredoxin oxidoreductase beta subunit
MSLSEYYSSEIEVVLSIMDSFYEFENNKERQEWERARFIAFMTVKPHDTKKKFKKPSDLIKFDWEQQQLEKDIDDLKRKMKRSRRMETDLYKKLMK